MLGYLKVGVLKAISSMLGFCMATISFSSTASQSVVTYEVLVHTNTFLVLPNFVLISTYQTGG